MGETKENQSDLKEIVKEIAENKILLPDFQRDFRWKKEEEQKKLVASVLARMPIGSILLLRSDPKEYGAKIIGSKNKKTEIADLVEKDKTVKFLLDGQQRVTVLTNVFSNIIFESCKSVSELCSPALKRRFFLRIPKWKELWEQNKKHMEETEELDLFGVCHFKFKYSDLKKDPEFLSGEIEQYIECKSFLASAKEPFHPYKELSTELDAYCMSQENGYYIPLFLLTADTDQGELRRDKILEKIAAGIKEEIESTYAGLTDEEERWQFLQEIFELKPERKSEWDTKEKVESQLEDKETLWKRALDAYLDACVKELKLNQIIMDAEQRSRAIDIYENMNRGGVSLNTFDLMMARVATVMTDSLNECMQKEMESEREYPLEVLPDVIKKEFASKNEYNATIETRCYDSNKDEFMAKYIDVFLEVLSLYCHNKAFVSNEYKLEHIKKDKILNLEPKEIKDNYRLACRAIDRAMFFFQTRCGIRYLSEINYSLMVVIVATIFMKEEYFYDKQVHDILEAWYWSSIFAGEFDRDQNKQAIQHLNKLTGTLQNRQNVAWIKNLKSTILNMTNFSDKEFLLMNKVNEDRVPKEILRNYVCQYWLAQTYTDMFEPNKKISVFCDEAENLEAHHIIPLGSVKKMKESTRNLRKDSKNICNSPLNFVFITKEANKRISADSLEIYAKRICAGARQSLCIKYNNEMPAGNTEKIWEVLEERYEALKGSIENKLNTLLP
ncbi:MAG: DUF262 domain-containing protein [Lachnospiraceae bacterium]